MLPAVTYTMPTRLNTVKFGANNKRLLVIEDSEMHRTLYGAFASKFETMDLPISYNAAEAAINSGNYTHIIFDWEIWDNKDSEGLIRLALKQGILPDNMNILTSSTYKASKLAKELGIAMYEKIKARDLFDSLI